MIIDRPLPHNIAAEQAILGCILKEPQLMYDVVSKIDSDAFYSPVNKTIFDCMKSVFNGSGTYTVDAVSLCTELERTEKLEECGGHVYLYELTENLPTTANIENWIKILKDISALRNGIIVANELITQAYSPDVDVKSILSGSVDKLNEVMSKTSSNNSKRLKTHLQDYIVNMKKMLETGKSNRLVSFNLPFLDFHIQLLRGEVLMLAAMPGGGKTALSLQAMKEQAMNGKRVVIYCAESSSVALVARIIGGLSKVKPLDTLAQPEVLKENERARVFKYVQDLAKLDDYLIIRCGKDCEHSLSAITADAKKIEKEYGQIDTIYVDYLQNMRCPQGIKLDNKVAQIEYNIEGLSRLGKELDCAMVILAQINRDGNKSGKPTKFDLKGSSAIEQEADWIVFLRDSDDKSQDERFVRKELYSEKTRMSNPFMSPLMFEGLTMTFSRESRYDDSYHPEPRTPYKDSSLV